MKKFKNNLIISILTTISRFGFFSPNFSPLGSFGFNSGSYLFYFASIIIFDFLRSGFYKGFYWNYIAFAIYPLLGNLAKKNLSKKLIFLPIASFLFFLISNFGVWLNWYSHTFSDLKLCYILALPFLRQTLMSDLLFTYSLVLGKTFIPKLLLRLFPERKTFLHI